MSPAGIRLTAKQIVEETRNFYDDGNNERAVDRRGNCVYNTDWHTHCAIGRCLMVKYQRQGMFLEGNASSIGGLTEKNGFQKKWFRPYVISKIQRSIS